MFSFQNQREKNHTHLEGSWPQTLLGDKATSTVVIHSVLFKGFKISTSQQTSEAQNGELLTQHTLLNPTVTEMNCTFHLSQLCTRSP